MANRGIEKKSARLVRPRHLLWLMVFVLLLLFMWWAFWRPQVVIKAERIERGDIELGVSAVGKVKPIKSVDVGAQVSGRILRILVKAGDKVKKGDLLLEIDPEIQEAEVRSDRAQLKSLQALLKEQEANQIFLNHKKKRYVRLLALDAVSKEASQETEKELAVVKAKIASLKAQIEGAESKLNGNLTQLSYTRIYASMDGTVITLDALEGQTINATYQTPKLLQLANLEQMTVWTEVSEIDVGHIQEQMPVYFTTLGLKNEEQQLRRWHSRLKRLLPAPPLVAQDLNAETVQNASRVVNYMALFDVDNTDALLMPQMTARVFFVQKQVQDVVLIPLKYLEFDQQSQAYKVRVMPKGGKAAGDIQMRTLKIGIKDSLNAEVLSGLQEGDQVVTELNKRLGFGHIRW